MLQLVISSIICELLWQSGQSVQIFLAKRSTKKCQDTTNISRLMCEVSCQEKSPSNIKSSVFLGIKENKTTQDMYKKSTRDVQEEFK